MGICIWWENVPKGTKIPPLIKPVGDKVDSLTLVESGKRTEQGKEVEKEKKGPLIAEWRLLLRVGIEQVPGYYCSTKGLYKSTLKEFFVRFGQIFQRVQMNSN